MKPKTTVYLAAILLLVANDHIFKHLWPGAVTGKLSDLAGVFALALFLGTFLPRTVACASAAGLFVWWKSPLSQAFIDVLPWPAARVVDWTDLLALVTLIAAFRLLPPAPRRFRMRMSIAVLSLFAFAATSVAHTYVDVVPADPLRTIETCATREAVLKSFKTCGFSSYSEDQKEFQVSVDVVIGGKTRETFAYVTVASDGTITLPTITVFGTDPFDAQAAKVAVHDRIAACASRCRR